MTAAEVEGAFGLFGVPLAGRLRRERPRDQAALDVIVEAAKADAEASFRRQVLRAHPDAGGSEAETQALLAARDVVRKVRLRMPAPRPQPVVVMAFSWDSNATTTTTQTTVRF